MALSVCTLARADKVHLQGGNVLEGKVSREGDKVVVELESGTIRIDARSVTRIEHAETPLERITRLRAGLSKAAVDERLALANMCREADLTRCERELLEEVIARDQDHAEARLRLGYVRGEHGWLSRDEQARKAARAESEARAESARALAEAQILRETAELSRKQAELSLARERLALQRDELARDEAARSPGYVTYFGPYAWHAGWHAGSHPGHAGSHPGSHPGWHPPALSPPHIEPYIINGVRAPDEGGFNLPGVRSPASYFH